MKRIINVRIANPKPAAKTPFLKIVTHNDDFIEDTRTYKDLNAFVADYFSDDYDGPRVTDAVDEIYINGELERNTKFIDMGDVLAYFFLNEDLVTCPNCDSHFPISSLEKDWLGWHTTCPFCESSFDVNVTVD